MSSRSFASLQNGVDDVCVEVNALQSLLQSISDELLRNSLLEDFSADIRSKLDDLMNRLEGIGSKTASQQAELQDLSLRLQAVQQERPPDLPIGCPSRTMSSTAASGAG